MSEPRVVQLTRRERDVVAELACDGASNAEIAERLGITEDTVKTVMRNALAAVGSANRTALAVDILRRRVLIDVVKQRTR